MPKIETFERTLRLPGGKLTARANPAAFAATGEAVAQAGNVLTDLGTRYIERQRRVVQAQRLADARLRAGRSYSDLLFGLQREGNPDTLEPAYKEAADRIDSALIEQAADDPELQGKLRQDLGTTRLAGLAAIRKRVIQGQNDAYQATLDETAREFVARMAQTDDPGIKASLGRQYTDALQSGVSLGLINRVDAGKRARGFLEGVDELEAMSDLHADPEAAATKIADPSSYPGLDPLRREQLVGTFETAATRAQQWRVSQAEKAEREAERRMKQAQAQTEGQFSNRIDQLGDVTSIDLGAALDRQDISPDGYRMLMNRMTQAAEGTDNPHVAVELNDAMVRDGRDIHDKTVGAYNHGDLSWKTASSLMDRNQERIDAGARRTWETADQEHYYGTMTKALGADSLMFSFDNTTALKVQRGQDEYYERVVKGDEDPKAVAESIVSKSQGQSSAPPPSVMPHIGFPVRTAADVEKAKAILRGLANDPSVSQAQINAEAKALQDVEQSILSQGEEKK